MNNLDLAMELLGVGMTTVFFILFLVVMIGNLIIRFVNKYIPEELPAAAAPAAEPDPRKVAAIVSAVKILTKGKGHVTKVEKI
ncbi:MAG: OadG family transporter subunit [Mangrovibacterium sp.]